MWRRMVRVGHVNTELVAKLNKMGASAVGPSGLSAKLYTQQKSRSVDEWNWVMSASHRINVKLLDSMMKIGLQFLHPLPSNRSGRIRKYHINADTAAGEVARPESEKLSLITVWDGIQTNPEDPKHF